MTDLNKPTRDLAEALKLRRQNTLLKMALLRNTLTTEMDLEDQGGASAWLRRRMKMARLQALEENLAALNCALQQIEAVDPKDPKADSQDEEPWFETLQVEPWK